MGWHSAIIVFVIVAWSFVVVYFEIDPRAIYGGVFVGVLGIFLVQTLGRKE